MKRFADGSVDERAVERGAETPRKELPRCFPWVPARPWWVRRGGFGKPLFLLDLI
jgi:hypothetical protein